MKITEVTIRLEPNASEEHTQGRGTIILIRNAQKQWSISNEDRGMFPYEVRLANEIQSLIIEKFNGKQV